jgi:trehalose 6-phosphate phosphatase
VLGHYGLERWEARTGEVVRPELPAGLADARRAVGEIVASAPEGTRLEDKDASLAVHTRGAADPNGALTTIRPALEDVASRTGLVVEPGRMVIELRPPGTDKGTALRSFVDDRSARSVLYAGDDLGDLAAYAAVEDLRSHGVAGLTVCASSEEVPQLAARADIVVGGPAGVVDLLDSLVAITGTGG